MTVVVSDALREDMLADAAARQEALRESLRKMYTNHLQKAGFKPKFIKDNIERIINQNME